jgi:hypothetical protein
MARTGRFLTVIALAALPLAACAEQDASHDDVVEALTDADAPDQQAACVADGLDELSQDQLNDVAGASDLEEDLDQGLYDTVRGVMDQCFNAAGADKDTSDTADDTTTTTEE